MAIDTLHQLINGLKNKHSLIFNKASAANMIAGALATRWRSAGTPPLGVIPTSAALCDKNTLGSWNLPFIPPGKKMYLGQINVSQSILGQFILFDRLTHMGGLSGIITTPQTVNLDVSAAAAQERCQQQGCGVMWGLQTYVNLGGTASTATINYTNQDDVSGRITTVAIPATMRVDSFYPILPNDNDLIIKSIQTLQLSISTGTAGNFGITSRIKITDIPIDVTSKNFLADYASLALPELTGNECLELCMVCQTTSTGLLMGDISIITN
jgi:hypothetical protein